MGEKKKIECTKHVVAFLDILGASEKIKKSSNDILNDIQALYYDAISMCKADETNYNFSALKIKIFSDNILVSYEVEDQDQSIKNQTYFAEIYVLMQFVRIFQALALEKKILLRGGVTIGELYFSDMFVWGNALLRAYELESHVAIYPRIIIDDIIIDNIVKTNFKGGNIFDTCNITQDTDLVFFVDYLKGWKSQEFLDNIILNSYEDVWHYLNNTLLNRITQKLTWHVNYVTEYLSGDIRNKITEPIKNIKI